MKIATLPGCRLRLTRFVRGALLLGAVALAWPHQASAVSVDSELLLLVDSTESGLNNRNFNELMDSYADAFSSSAVLDAIQSGTYGRIAVSLMFFGNARHQSVGIPWMSIGSAAEAETFAMLLRVVNRPPSPGTIQIDNGLLAAIPYFGTETGAAGNGFESTTQLIEVVAASTPTRNNPAPVNAARDQALASGVDVIGAIAVGSGARDTASYFRDNVIGGEAGGVQAESRALRNGNDDPASFLVTQVTRGVNAGAAESLSAVPEPSPVLALVSGLGLLCLRRRRQVG